MGTNIGSLIEIKKSNSWSGQNDIFGLNGSDRDSYSAILGTGFIPFSPAIPMERGFPREPSLRLKRRISSGSNKSFRERESELFATWVTYDELKDVDWNEESNGRDRRFTVYDENKRSTGSKFLSIPSMNLSREEIERLQNGELVEYSVSDEGNRYLKKEKLSRVEALNDSWEFIIFELLPLYADKFGEECTRIVFWK